MNTIRGAYALLFIALTLAWLAAGTALPVAGGVFAWRPVVLNGTGILAIGAMSVGMMLATRPVWIERWLGGLDKSYRLHKWLGISAALLSIVHWGWVNVPKWLVGAGWLVRPARAPSTVPSEPVYAFLQRQRGLAEGLGEWAFYALMLLVALALLKRLPYRHFFRIHRLLALVFLVLVCHAVVLMEFTQWDALIGPLMLLLMAGGSAAAAVSLLGQVGHRRRAVGVIDELVLHPDNRVLKIGVRLQDRWAGHEDGQFAFVSFSADEGAHPFTIASSWQGDGRLVFLVKGLGDYTDILPATLKLGDVVKVEGPYGCFDFAASQPRQVWVAGGIGIAPFIARMEALAGPAQEAVAGAVADRPVDLFYSTRMPDQNFLALLRQLAQRAGVKLHVLVDPRDGVLSAERLFAGVPDWRSASVWFCGPVAFGTSLRKALAAGGGAADDFHQELFDLR
jgi:predicted ferric reductase